MRRNNKWQLSAKYYNQEAERSSLNQELTGAYVERTLVMELVC